MAWAIERNPDIDPILVVAPVSLLENWKEEVDKFFVRDAFPILTAYGDDLAALRVPRESIDQRLREDGLVKFLRPNRTSATKDNGIDVVALAHNELVGKLVQAKSSGRSAAALDWDAVKEVVGGQAFYEKQFPGVAFGKVCITNQYFNEQARQNAALNGVELVEQPQLLSMLKDTPVTVLDVERVLFTEWKDTQ